MHLQTEPATLPRIGRGDRGGDRCGDRWTRPCPLDGELHPREGFGKMLSRGLVGLCRDSQAGLSALTTADGGEWRAPSAVRGSNVLFWLLEREIPHVSRGGPHQNLVTEATKSIEIYRSAGVETELGLGKGALGRTNDRSISKGKMEMWPHAMVRTYSRRGASGHPWKDLRPREIWAPSASKEKISRICGRRHAFGRRERARLEARERGEREREEREQNKQAGVRKQSRVPRLSMGTLAKVAAGIGERLRREIGRGGRPRVGDG